MSQKVLRKSPGEKKQRKTWGKKKRANPRFGKIGEIGKSTPRPQTLATLVAGHLFTQYLITQPSVSKIAATLTTAASYNIEALQIHPLLAFGSLYYSTPISVQILPIDAVSAAGPQWEPLKETVDTGGPRL